MVVGVGLYVFGLLPFFSSLCFLFGSILFAWMQALQRYDGQNITIRRLRRIMLVADFCFVLSGLLMAEQTYQVLFRQMVTTAGGYTAYVQLVWNNWVVALLIGAVLEIYTMHRISHELKK